MPREFARHERLGAQVLRSLSELIRHESKDPRLAHVSLTAVDLSRDLGVARVYFSLLHPEDDPGEALEGLTSASGFLRRKLGEAITVRHVPELRFEHDESAARAVHIDRLLNAAGARDPDSAEDGQD